MRSKNRRCDPEPFTIVVGIAGIISGVAGTVFLYQTFGPVSLKRPHRQVVLALERIVENLTSIETATHEMERAISAGIELGPRPFLLGSRIVLVPEAFSRYVNSADRVMQLLRILLKDTHRIEKHMFVLPYFPQPEMREAVDLQLRIEDLLRGRARRPAESLAQIRAIVARVRSFADDLRNKLRGDYGQFGMRE